MPESAHSPRRLLLLAIDTCGPTGSVALGELVEGELRILGEKELAGRSYSSTLVASISELLQSAEVPVSRLNAIVVVSGPGSFTGVRVGLSAVKGLAEGRSDLSVLAVSRLEVLASKADAFSAALDAHRGEVFLRIAASTAESRELLAGAKDLTAVDPPPARIAVCDDSAAALLHAAWLDTELVRVESPTAVDALTLCAPRIVKGEHVDLALLDGHYLRRSDAEIFGAPTPPELRGQ
jgi:tRNA threonylcarbamoyladenosine biosynthesis protein TsaB